MRFTALIVSAFAVLAAAENDFLNRRADKSCTPGNNCQRGVGGTNGKPALNSRLADCRALNTVTVIPATVTETVYVNTVAVRIPTGMPVKRQADGSPAAPVDTPVAVQEEPTTILPTATPTYATYCKAATAYFSACSCAGATAATTTLAAPTTTVTETNDGCPVRSAVKRAGEAMGYKFAPRWEEYNMPGYKLF